MKKAFLALLLLVGAAATLANAAFAQDEGVRMPTYQLLRQSLAAKSQDLRTSAASDSQFVGHSHTNHYSATTNPWNIYVGTLRPGINPANTATWDFDNQVGLGAGDSLQGWWPITLPYRYGTALATMTDHDRPWSEIDQGNQVNARPLHTGAGTRAFGVTGVWHADPGRGTAGTLGALVRWTPLAGSQSMWCGLRALNDNTVSDPITGQPYNEGTELYNVFGTAGQAYPTAKAFPGYCNQWDQILYRDFTAANNTALTVSFLYRTQLSTAFLTSILGRNGWYHGDPLSTASPNFISSTDAGANAPEDSFSVYIGCPVNDAACVFTDATISPSPVFDKQRRWFDEVIRIDAPYFEILGVAGGDSTTATGNYNATIPFNDPGNGNAYIGAIYNAAGNAAHKVRLAFRLKTNHDFSDEDYKSGSGVLFRGYTSGGWGGVQLDNVNVGGTLFDFEGAGGGVDNNTATDPSLAWKSTGKPIPTYFHPVDVSTVAWNDVCGQPGAVTSQCNMIGIAASVGNADQAGSIADVRWASTNEWVGGFVSPVISLVTTGTATPNEMGITGDMKQASDDYYIQYDINFAAFELASTGTLWNFGVQVYPAFTANGHNTWSDVTGSPFRIFNNFPGCQGDLEQFKANSMIHTSNANGVPDSMKVYMGITSECFVFGGTCNSTAGGYFDNISLIIANKLSADPVGSISSDIWQFFNDAFPTNGYTIDNVAAGTAGFDTTTAMIKGGINNAPVTGDASRFDVPADSVTVSAPNGTGTDPSMRVDLVFRILPGPGNYKAVAGRVFPPTTAMQLLRVPTNQTNVVSSHDGSFWGEYIFNPGQFASPSAHAGGKWDYLAWNSARCDTVEGNVFPIVGKASSGVDAAGNTYQSTYHESDPHYEALGILKGRCFLIDPTGAFNSTNVSCDTTFTKVPGNLIGDYELAAGSGFDGRFSTKEYTKILPDGLLTPGSHVQYFFRKQRVDLTGSFIMDPDTTTISPQLVEGNFDGHRWQQFGVLPDRWKGTEFGGSGMACMLYIDNNDRRGDERIWVSVMDSIGGTASTKFGAHNGWHAPGAGFGLNSQTNPNIANAFVRNKNQQPGTAWDMYGVKASESSTTGGAHIGNRYATQPGGLMTGKGATIGPRKDWLRNYYHMISWLTGDLSFNNVGPVTNIGQDDIGLIEDFLSTSTGTAQPRQLLVQGDGFAEQEDANGGVHLDFLNNFLFCGLRDASYTNLTPGLVPCPDLIVDPAIAGTTIYGVANSCVTLNDVLQPGTVENTVEASYQAVGANAPYRAGIEHAANGTHNWHSVINGWDMFNTYSRFCATSNGRLSYYYNLMVNAFGSVCANWGTPPTTLDVPNNQHGGQFVNFMKVGNSVMRTSSATIHFGVANAGRVRVRLYDVTGRVIKTVADRNYEAGNDYAIQWNGTDDSGNQVARGVYFARIEFAKGAAINGRVVVLR